MAGKDYWMKFGSGDPRINTGLFPTFVIFSAQGLTAMTGPTIMELPVGSGCYHFQYGTTQGVIFLADGGNVLSSTDRFVTATLDPIQAVDQQIGYSTDSFGSTSVDPTTIWGFVKRIIELFEGDSIFTKATGIWQIFNRGSTTLLRTKNLTNNTTSANKTGL